MRDSSRHPRLLKVVFYIFISLVLLLLSQRPLYSDRGSTVTETEIFPSKNGRSFTVRPDQQGVSELGPDGRTVLWTREFGSILTTSSVAQELSAWGFLDGKVQILDRDGKILRGLNPQLDGVASAHPCVYALAISNRGEALAMLYGISPQYFLVYERKDGFYSLVLSLKLDADLRTAQSGAFSGDAETVLMKTADGLAFYNLPAKKGGIIHPKLFQGEGEYLIEAFGEDKFVFLGARADDRFSGIIENGSLKAFFRLPGDSVALRIGEESFYVKRAEKALEFRRRQE